MKYTLSDYYEGNWSGQLYWDMVDTIEEELFKNYQEQIFFDITNMLDEKQTLDNVIDRLKHNYKNEIEIIERDDYIIIRQGLTEEELLYKIWSGWQKTVKVTRKDIFKYGNLFNELLKYTDRDYIFVTNRSSYGRDPFQHEVHFSNGKSKPVIVTLPEMMFGQDYINFPNFT